MDKKAKYAFKTMLINHGYSKKAAEELWKWYTFSEKKTLPASSSIHCSVQIAIWTKVIYHNAKYPS